VVVGADGNRIVCCCFVGKDFGLVGLALGLAEQKVDDVASVVVLRDVRREEEAFVKQDLFSRAVRVDLDFEKVLHCSDGAGMDRYSECAEDAFVSPSRTAGFRV